MTVSPEPTPTSNSSYEEKASENNNSQPIPTPDTTIKKSTPVVTSSPSLMDTLRDAKESQKASPPPENTVPESIESRHYVHRRNLHQKVLLLWSSPL